VANKLLSSITEIFKEDSVRFPQEFCDFCADYFAHACRAATLSKRPHIFVKIPSEFSKLLFHEVPGIIRHEEALIQLTALHDKILDTSLPESSRTRGSNLLEKKCRGVKVERSTTSPRGVLCFVLIQLDEFFAGEEELKEGIKVILVDELEQRAVLLVEPLLIIGQTAVHSQSIREGREEVESGIRLPVEQRNGLRLCGTENGNHTTLTSLKPQKLQHVG
jgi:hypothetical protein